MAKTWAVNEGNAAVRSYDLDLSDLNHKIRTIVLRYWYIYFEKLFINT